MQFFYLMHIDIANSTSQMSINDLGAVVDYLWPVRSKWDRIGIHLGIDVGTVDAIKKDHRDSGDCLYELMNVWLRGMDPKPTWKALVGVLKSPPIGEPGV